MASNQEALEELRELAEDVKIFEEYSDENLTGYLWEKFSDDALRQMDYSIEEKDFDTAMDCLGLILELERESGSITERVEYEAVQCAAMHKAANMMRDNELCSESGCEFKRAFGQLEEPLEDVKRLGQKIVPGSGRGFALSVICLAVLAALTLVVWFFPPVLHFLNDNMTTIAVILIFLAGIAAFVLFDSSFLAAGITVAVLFFLGNLYEQHVPLEWQTPIAVNLTRAAVTAILVFFGSGLPKAIRRNHYAMIHREELEGYRKRFQEENRELYNRCKELKAPVSSLFGNISTHLNRFNDHKESNIGVIACYDVYCQRIDGGKASPNIEAMIEAVKRLRDEIKLIRSYYEYVENKARAAAPKE